MASPKRDAVLEKLYVRLLRLAAYIGVRPSDVEDIVQQVYVVLAKDRYKDLECEEDLVPLSSTILKKLHLGAWRKTAREVPLDPTIDPPAPSEDSDKREVQQQMKAAILTMGDSCRELFLLQLEGYTYDDIAERLQVTKNNAYVMLNRCLAKLREKMGVKRASK